jgi:hypothetical protein
VTLNKNGVECKLADPCVHCAYGMPHRAQVLVYDPAAGDYVKLEAPFCLARWEKRGPGHAGGGICGRPATHHFAGMDFCDHHHQRLLQWGSWERPRRANKAATQALRASAREVRKEVAAEEAAREQAREAERARYSVVYFVRQTNGGAIKIGTTRQPATRFKYLSQVHGQLELLLTLSGDRALEKKMHDRFDMYRESRRTEWFTPARTLLEWIYNERRFGAAKDCQQESAVPIANLQELARSAPRDSRLQWIHGRAVWPQAADPAA